MRSTLAFEEIKIGKLPLHLDDTKTK